MLDIKNAKLIKEAIDKHFAPHKSPVDLETICRMQPVPVNVKGSGYTILSTQYGDLTILVWVQINETLGFTVRAVKTQAW